jgi:Holliday junction DNA helicase RuvA
VIGYLRGRVLRVTPEIVVLDVNGVGYLVAITAAARDRMPSAGGETELHVYTQVREDQLALFGFASVEELDMFRMLIEVDGVGPKVGLAILSSANLDNLKRAILTDDVGPIRRAPGVGPRTAQKVIIDLKPKLEADAALAASLSRIPVASGAPGSDATRQVEATLRNLGFSAAEARSAVDSIDWAADPSPQEALATALKSLGR